MPNSATETVKPSLIGKLPTSSAISVETLSTTVQIAGIFDRERILLEELQKLQEKKKWLADVLKQVGYREYIVEDGSVDGSVGGLQEHEQTEQSHRLQETDSRAPDRRRQSRLRSEISQTAHQTRKFSPLANQMDNTQNHTKMPKRSVDSKERLRVLGESSQRLNAQLQDKISELTGDQRFSEFDKSDSYNFLNTYTRKLGYLKARALLSKTPIAGGSKVKSNFVSTRLLTGLDNQNVVSHPTEKRRSRDGAPKWETRIDVSNGKKRDKTEQVQFVESPPGKIIDQNSSKQAPVARRIGEITLSEPNDKLLEDEFTRRNDIGFGSPEDSTANSPSKAAIIPGIPALVNASIAENMQFSSDRPSLVRRAISSEILNSGRILSPKLISLASMQHKNIQQENDTTRKIQLVQIKPLVPPQDAILFIDTEFESRSLPHQGSLPSIPRLNFSNEKELMNETRERFTGDADMGEEPLVSNVLEPVSKEDEVDLVLKKSDASTRKSEQSFEYNDDFLPEPEAPLVLRPTSPFITAVSGTPSDMHFVVDQPDDFKKDGVKSISGREHEELSVAIELSDGEVTPRAQIRQVSPGRWENSDRGKDQEGRFVEASPPSSERSISESHTSVADVLSVDDLFDIESNRGANRRETIAEGDIQERSFESEMSSVRSDFLSGSSSSSNRTLQDSRKDHGIHSSLANNLQRDTLNATRFHDTNENVQADEHIDFGEKSQSYGSVLDRGNKDSKRALEPSSPKVEESHLSEELNNKNLSSLETVSSLSRLSSTENDDVDAQRYHEEREVPRVASDGQLDTLLAESSLNDDSLNEHSRNRESENSEVSVQEEVEIQEQDLIPVNKVGDDFDFEDRTEDDIESVDSVSLLVSFSNNAETRSSEQINIAQSDVPTEEYQATDKLPVERTVSLWLEIPSSLRLPEVDLNVQNIEENRKSPASVRSLTPLSSVSAFAEDLKSSSGDEKAEIFTSPKSIIDESLDSSSSSPRKPSPRNDDQAGSAIDQLVSPRAIDTTMPVQDWMEDDFFTGILPPSSVDRFKDLGSPGRSARVKSPPTGDFVRQARIEKTISYVQDAARYIHSVVRQNKLNSFFDVQFPPSEFSSGFNQEIQMAFDSVADFCDLTFVLPGLPPVPSKRRFPEYVEHFLKAVEGQFARNTARLVLPDVGIKLDRNERDELEQQAVYDLSFKDLERHENEWCNFTQAEASLKVETTNEIWDNLVDEMVLEFQENKHFDEWLRKDSR